MGRYVSREEKLAKRAAKKKQHADIRKANREIANNSAKTMQSQLRQILANCGLSQAQISDFSGVSPTVVCALTRRYRGTVRLSTVVGLARAAGYHLELVPNDPRNDKFREHRRVNLPPLPEDSKPD